MHHGDMINGSAYQCVNVAKRRQIAAPGHFKRAHSADPFPSKTRARQRRREITSISRRRILPNDVRTKRAKRTEKYFRL